MKFAFNLLLLLFLFVNSIFSQGLIDVQPAGINWENGQVNNNEPSIAINPADINNIILATNHRVLGINGCGSNATKSLGIYRSLDKGATWSTPYTMPRTHNLSYYADPSIAFSSDGTAYCGYLGEGGNTSVIFVNYSTNKGIS